MQRRGQAPNDRYSSSLGLHHTRYSSIASKSQKSYSINDERDHSKVWMKGNLSKLDTITPIHYHTTSTQLLMQTQIQNKINSEHTRSLKHMEVTCEHNRQGNHRKHCFLANFIYACKTKHTGFICTRQRIQIYSIFPNLKLLRSSKLESRYFIK